MKKTKGITLIALVITIIILLILAGVSISLVFNSNGLFSKANEVASRYNQAKDDEQTFCMGTMSCNRWNKYKCNIFNRI